MVATYGRIRLLAEALVGKTERLIAIGGNVASRRLPGVPGTEADGYVETPSTLVSRMIETEQAVLGNHARGRYVATIIRYPYVYGPYSVVPAEWHVIQRVRDDRRRWLMPGGGLGLSTRCAAPNAAHLVGLVIDQPEVAGGQAYEAADDRQYTFREWTSMLARLLDYEFEFVDVPWSALPTPAGGSLSVVPQGGGPRGHELRLNTKAKHELGYADVVTPESWLRQTVEYWLEFPPPVDGEGNHLKPEQFDYASEDRLLEWWDGVLASAPRDLGSIVTTRHPYPHPLRPGEQREG